MKILRNSLWSASAILLLASIAFAQSGNSARHQEVIAYEHRASDSGDALSAVDIDLVNSDGTDVKALTQDHHSHSPSWSPDGQRILFIHNSTLQTAPYNARPGAHNSGHPDELYVMDRDGGNAHLLRRFEPVISGAAWSPDGKMLAVNFNGGLYLLPADAQGEPHLLFSYVLSAAWSPDSRRLAFSAPAGHAGANSGTPAGQQRFQWTIHIANADSSMESEINYPTLMAQDPAWSPDGQEIAFSDGRIFVVNQVSSEVRQLTNDPQWRVCLHPSWSPDGERLAFACFDAQTCYAGSSPAPNPPCTPRIFVIPVQNPPSKLVPILDSDGLNPVFAPKN